MGSSRVQIAARAGSPGRGLVGAIARAARSATASRTTGGSIIGASDVDRISRRAASIGLVPIAALDGRSLGRAATALGLVAPTVGGASTIGGSANGSSTAPAALGADTLIGLAAGVGSARATSRWR